jgi:hypothetical protein
MSSDDQIHLLRDALKALRTLHGELDNPAMLTTVAGVTVNLPAARLRNAIKLIETARDMGIVDSRQTQDHAPLSHVLDGSKLFTTDWHGVARAPKGEGHA